MSEQTITLNKRGRKLPLTSELECGCKLTMHALGFTTFTFCKMHEAASTMLAALEAVDWGWRKGDDLVGPMRMVRAAIAAAKEENRE